MLRIGYVAYRLVFTLAVGWILYGIHRSYYDNPWLYGTRLQQWDELADNLNTTYIWEGSHDRIIDNITFIVMASSVNAQRHISQRLSWMRMVQHVYAFSDQKGPYTMTLPQLSGRSSFADAQQRQPRGMQWIFNSSQPSTAWYLLVDDDTWVNVPMLGVFLRQLTHLHKSIIAGYRYDDSFNGGGGIVLNQQGFNRIAEALYKKPCDAIGMNDQIITRCAQALGGFHFVHSNLFRFYPHQIAGVNDFIDYVSVHPVKNAELMRKMTRVVQARTV